MRLEGLQITAPFKRFHRLTISSIPEQARLVVLVGPNGSGKSSVFDAILHWAHNSGRKLDRRDDSYYDRPGEKFKSKVQVHFHGEVPDRPGRNIHVRSAYRYTPTIKTTGITKQESLLDKPAVFRMIDQDVTGTRHYQTLVGRFVELISDLTQERRLQDIKDAMAPLETAVNRLFPDLQLAGLGSPLEAGSFFFRKDGQPYPYHYDVLSSGEKAAFDLLLDLFVTATAITDGVICLDEPESHLNPRVQGALVDEMLRLVPRDTQVWVATHSIGFLRRAMELHRTAPEEIVFLDLQEVPPDEHVHLEPRTVSRDFWQAALATALDDFAGLIAPRVMVLCEGSPSAGDKADVNVAWDAQVLSQAFGDKYPDVEFVSVGGKGQLNEVAKTFSSALSRGTTVLRLRDRDDLTDARREELLDEDEALRILSRRTLESYLLSDAVLELLVDEYGVRQEDALEQLKDSRNRALEAAKVSGDAKAALGEIYSASRRVLRDNGQLGENKFQFARDVLAPILANVPDLQVLEKDLRLPQ